MVCVFHHEASISDFIERVEEKTCKFGEEFCWTDEGSESGEGSVKGSPEDSVLEKSGDAGAEESFDLPRIDEEDTA